MEVIHVYYHFNVVIIGSGILFIYIIIDLFKNGTKNWLHRFIFYTFIFYLCNVVQLTTGGIVFPPQDGILSNVQFIPFYFLYDWFNMYSNDGFDWFFWNAIKLTLYNVILLLPLGVYISLLWKPLRLEHVALIIFLSSLTIEISQLALGSLGFVIGRSFDVDDLILNTLGGVMGYIIAEFLLRVRKKKTLKVS